MNYRQACLKKNVEPKPKAVIKEKAEIDEKVQFNKECAKAVRTLYLRWEKHKRDYIELHGEDMYNYMHLTPNYWVMPEEDEMEEESDKCNEYETAYSSHEEE